MLTRLPAPHRLRSDLVSAAVEALGLAVLALSPREYLEVVQLAGRANVRGGAVYDAMIAWVAKDHDLRLLTLDERARTTYEAVGVGFDVL